MEADQKSSLSDAIECIHYKIKLDNNKDEMI